MLRAGTGVLGGLVVGVSLAAVPVAAQVRTGQPAKTAEPALAAVPTDAFYFASVKLSKLWDHSSTKPLRDWVLAQKGGAFDMVLGIPPAELDRVTIFAATPAPAAGGAPVVAATARKQLDEAKLLKMLGGKAADRRLDHRSFEVGGLFQRVVLLDERTVMYLPRDLDHDSLGRAFESRFRARKTDGALAQALVAAAGHDLAIGIDMGSFRALLGEFNLDGNKQLAPYLGLTRAKTALLTADFAATANARFTLTFADAASAKEAEPLLRDGIKALNEYLTRESNPFDRFEKALASWLSTFLKDARVSSSGAELTAVAEAPFAAELARLVAALPKQLASNRNETVALNNLKQLALAMHNFESTNGRLPGDVMKMGDNTLAWSWRVQLLPYIEQQNLYQMLDFTKPWDDPANLKLLESFEMPRVFELPGREAPKGHTYYRVFSLPKNTKSSVRPFFKEGEIGPSIASISDGTSNSIMIIEAGEAVPWYKLDILPYDEKKPLPPIGDDLTDRMIFAFGDGSVRSIRPSRLGEKTIRAMITIDGGEPVNFPR